MQGVLQGFGTIGLIIALGYLLARINLLDHASQVMLTRLAYFVATPALMLTVLAGTDLAHVFTKALIAYVASSTVVAVGYILTARLLWRRDVPDTVIGALASMYVNAGNLGLPIAAYVLGDAALIAPTMLVQLMVFQPIALNVLDQTTSGRAPTLRRTFSQPFTNPLTVASLIGVALSLTGAQLPRVLADPLDLVGGMAVPTMLLAYGVSLSIGPRPGAAGSVVEIGWIVGLKMVAQPVIAYLVGRLVLGLDEAALLAVTVSAALPTAQNIFIWATRYDRSVMVARDAIFWSTLASVPVIFAIVAMLA